MIIENAAISLCQVNEIGDDEWSVQSLMSKLLNGTVDLTDQSDVNLMLVGQLEECPDAFCEINGKADLIEGDFRLNVRVTADDLSQLSLLRESAQLDSLDGRLWINLELLGTDELSLNGQILTSDLSADHKNRWHVRQGNINLMFSGDSVILGGDININGLSLPLEGNMTNLVDYGGTSADTIRHNPSWQVVIDTSQLDVSLFDGDQFGVPELSGLIDINLSLSGNMTDWYGQVAMVGDSIAVGNFNVHSANIGATVDAGIIHLQQMNAALYGGRFDADGSYDLHSGSTDLDWRFERRWTSTDSIGWSHIPEPFFTSQGNLSNFGNGWTGNSAINFMDDDGDTLLIGNITLHDNQVGLFCQASSTRDPVHPDTVIRYFALPEVGYSDSSAWLRLAIDLRDDSPDFLLVSENFNRALKPILTDRYLPDILQDYDVYLQIASDDSTQGDPSAADYPSDINIYVGLESISSDRQGVLRGKLFKNSRNFWAWDLIATIIPPDRRYFTARTTGEYTVEQLKINRLTLSDESDRQLLEGHCDIYLIQNDTKRTRPRLIDNLEFTTDNLPVTQLIEAIFPEQPATHTTFLDALIEKEQDTLFWGGSLTAVFDDSAQFIGESSGHHIFGYGFLDRLRIIDVTHDREVLAVHGAIDLAGQHIDSLIVVTDELPVERILQLLRFKKSSSYGGLLNVRLDAVGSFYHPELTVDLHLMDGIVRDLPGYWVNLNLTTVDNLYWLNNFDFGYGISALTQATGFMDRYDKSYRTVVIGQDVDVRSMIRTFAGVPGPLTGLINYDITLVGGDCQQNANIRLLMSPGKIGPLGFDRLGADLTLTGLDQGQPHLSVDSMTINWGLDDLANRVLYQASGSMPLSGDKPLSVNGFVEGRLMALLPRIDPYFSKPKGDGRLSFHLGGTIKHPLVTGARFEL
ncbi:MAG: hypothetical protein P9M15_06525, partial [Candidatus Electryoneaceae bacterium]|nr:hypothetical protein [Candidatus Electryoneaceae bacterium]